MLWSGLFCLPRQIRFLELLLCLGLRNRNQFHQSLQYLRNLHLRHIFSCSRHPKTQKYQQGTNISQSRRTLCKRTLELDRQLTALCHSVMFSSLISTYRTQNISYRSLGTRHAELRRLWQSSEVTSDAAESPALQPAAASTTRLNSRAELAAHTRPGPVTK